MFLSGPFNGSLVLHKISEKIPTMLLRVRCRFSFLTFCRLALAGILLGLNGLAICHLPAAPADYLIDLWGTEDGLPGSSVAAIAQTPDGYLWVGTYDGLARFDGVRFVTYDPGNTPALSHARIQGLYVDAGGTLWINTYRGGLTSYRDGVFRREWPDRSWFDFHTTLISSTSNHRSSSSRQTGQVLKHTLNNTNSEWNIINPPGPDRPIYQCTDRDGNVWFLSRDAHIVRLLGNKYENLPLDSGIGTNHVFTIAADAQGTIWAGVENEIARWNGSHFEDMTPTNMASTNLDVAERFEPTGVFPTVKGALWILSSNGQLREQQDRRWVTEATPWRGLLGWASGRAMGMHEDRDGGIWFNHYGNGLFHITPEGKYERFTTRDGLPGDRVGTYFEDKDGGIWAGTYRGGLSRFRERRFRVIGLAEGLPAQTALSLCQDSNGAIWIGTGDGLCRWQNNKLRTYPVGNTSADAFVFSVFPGTMGNLWLSAGDGEDLFQFQSGKDQRAACSARRGMCTASNPLLRSRSQRSADLWLGTSRI